MVAEGLAPARLYVCKSNNAGTCVAHAQQTVNSCTYSDAECRARGGVAYNSASAPNTAPCAGYSGTRACAFQHTVCAQWSLPPTTHWEVVTTTLP